MRNYLGALTRNPISLFGTAVATASGALIVTLFVLEMVGFVGSPYLGILAYLILPGVFLFGLVLVPIGIRRARRLRRLATERGETVPRYVVIDLNLDRTRRIVLILFFLTVVNLVILAAATYKGVEVLDSTEFCGTTCHTVMTPEFTAYRRSPHSRVGCVECHIGPGADWFVKSKLSGAWQVVAVTFDLYPRPIPTPIHNLRPARETCEQCHWPTKFVGDRLKVITHYQDDEANTETKTVLLLRVGGVEGRASHGIHWHVDPSIMVRYRSDDSREQVYDVELTLPDGTTKRFSAAGSPEDDGGPEAGTWRVMDCVDCHNRPTHIYRMPESEIDAAIRQGTIDRGLPYVRREGLAALRGGYGSHAQAREAIAKRLGGFYEQNYPDLVSASSDGIAQAAATLGDLYGSNVFPEMKVDWGTYPNHLGHTDFPGCFRCHDDLHTTADGETIPQDCFTCHTLLAMDEENPKVLENLQP